MIAMIIVLSNIFMVAIPIIVLMIYGKYYCEIMDEKRNEEINEEIKNIQANLGIKNIKMYVEERCKEFYDVNEQYKGDAGFDLYILESGIIEPKSTYEIKLGVYCEPCDNLAYDLRCRSSIYKTPLRLCNSVGTIDANYRGEIKAMVDNISNEVYHLKKGDRLFQLVSGDGRKINVNFVEKNELTITDRGNNGFGSTSVISIGTPRKTQRN